MEGKGSFLREMRSRLVISREPLVVGGGESDSSGISSVQSVTALSITGFMRTKFHKKSFFYSKFFFIYFGRILTF